MTRLSTVSFVCFGNGSGSCFSSCVFVFVSCVLLVARLRVCKHLHNPLITYVRSCRRFELLLLCMFCCVLVKILYGGAIAAKVCAQTQVSSLFSHSHSSMGCQFDTTGERSGAGPTAYYIYRGVSRRYKVNKAAIYS